MYCSADKLIRISPLSVLLILLFIFVGIVIIILIINIISIAVIAIAICRNNIVADQDFILVNERSDIQNLIEVLRSFANMFIKPAYCTSLIAIV